MEIIQSYIAHLDMKKRLTLRGSRYEYYHVREYKNGCLLLEPRVLETPGEISQKTLEMMDLSIKNLRAGIVSKPIDLSTF